MARRDLARQTVASAAITAKPLLRILDLMMALAAECNVNGQGARLKPQTDEARESGRKSGDLQAGRLMRHAIWRMKPTL
jgi:hypothetical protein